MHTKIIFSHLVGPKLFVISYIIHTASPFIINSRNEDDLIKPAVNCTLSIMRAAKANKVKRVVITSSVAAIYNSTDRKKLNFTAEDWSDP